jgi:RNA polymerase sigma-70 factor (ECF subfamily)
MERTVVNGQPGALVRDGSGALVNVFVFDVADGQVHAVRSVLNREKLQHLVPEVGPLADIEALRRAAILNRGP